MYKKDLFRSEGSFINKLRFINLVKLLEIHYELSYWVLSIPHWSYSEALNVMRETFSIANNANKKVNSCYQRAFRIRFHRKLF